MIFFEFLRSDLFIASTAIILILASLLFNQRRTNLTAYWLVGFFLLLTLYINIVSFRPLNAGNDTAGYVRVFNCLEDVESASALGSKLYGNEEFLFWKASACLKYFTSNPRIFIFIVSICSLFLVLLCVRTACVHYCKEEAYLYPILCLCSYYAYCLVYFGNHLRASIAIPLCVLAMLLQLQRRRTFWSVLCLLLALGMHLSAIFFIPFIFLTKWLPSGNTLRFRLLLIAILFLIWISGMLFFSYFQSENFEYGILGIKNKVILYSTHNFNLDSIYESVMFWFITTSILISIALGVSRIHYISIYIYSLILFTSPVAKLSERFFPFILILLPLIFYISIRKHFDTKHSIAITSIVYAVYGILVSFTDSAIYTLGLNRLI